MAEPPPPQPSPPPPGSGPPSSPPGRRAGEASPRAAFYASPGGGWRDWWTVLHPPYTAWHLSYVVIGACLAPRVIVGNLVATLLAFFLAVGLAAHALDELQGRPLRTSIPDHVLVAVTLVALAGAVALGIAGVVRVGWALVPFLVVGPLLVAGYNLELGGRLLHNDLGFALAWGAFPVLTAYVAQTGGLSAAAVLAALGATGLSSAQRRLSTPARLLRRRTVRAEGRLVLSDGSTRALDVGALLGPLEGALRAMSWALVVLATALAVARLT